jgi:hypothetical protein
MRWWIAMHNPAKAYAGPDPVASCRPDDVHSGPVFASIGEGAISMGDGTLLDRDLPAALPKDSWTEL